MTTLFAPFAEVKRDLISERPREGLAKAGSPGKKLGWPKMIPTRLSALPTHPGLQSHGDAGERFVNGR